MSSQSIRSEIVRLEKRCADLEKEKARHQAAAAKADKAASDDLLKSGRASSVSSQRSYLQSAERNRVRAADEQKKSAGISGKIAEERRRLSDRQRQLESALKSDQRATDRETEKRRRIEKEHAREVGRLSRVEVRHIMVSPPKKEMLRVLYLTSSPDADPNRRIRVDAEVNSVLAALRGAKYRDQIDIQVRPAARPQDLLDGINDVRPHVVHFSGHGDAGILAFDNADLGNPDTVIVDFRTLGQLLAATNTPPTLLVMNACSSVEGSEPLLDAVPILIGMSDSVGDVGAGVFATHFYAAIASAQPIGKAIEQAKAMMVLALMRNDADLIEVRSRSDVDPNEITLISL